MTGDELRELRTNAGLSQSQLARLAGYDQSHICNVEAGRKGCNARLEQSILRALAVYRRLSGVKKGGL